MSPTQPRGSRVIYVAAAAREFPQEVHSWLEGPGSKVTRSPNLYDTLALLTTGRRPAALLVSISSVDWTEMEFFEHAARLSPQTVLFVAGDAAAQAKLEAAVNRGAVLFDPDALTELLTVPSGPARHAGPRGLLAGSLQADPPAPAVQPVSPSAESPATDRAVIPEPQEPESRPEPPAPPVRLVAAPEENEELDTPVPFPWSPAANRPQRTPPRAAPGSAEHGRRPPVKLTPEELAALLGKPPEPGAAQEGGS